VFRNIKEKHAVASVVHPQKKYALLTNQTIKLENVIGLKVKFVTGVKRCNV
jgi:hypothetical protein